MLTNNPTGGVMATQGKYIYCIIKSHEGRNFGPIGIGGQGDNVGTVGYRDLSAVVSNSSMDKYVINRVNMMAHEKVVEEVMKDYTVLPVRFCTIATSAEEVRSLLRKRYSEFKNLLRSMDNKVELGLRIRWKNKNDVIREIVEENEEIREQGSRLTTRTGDDSSDKEEKVELGKRVKELLEKKSRTMAENILVKFSRASVDATTNKLTGDDMVLNAAFLVDRTHEGEFDSLVDDLEAEIGSTVDIDYVGPAPAYNFVNISVDWA
jgi:hypothetical protein